MSSGLTLPLHRCRFMEWQPHAITALCWAPLADPSNWWRLALARSDGTCQIWSVASLDSRVHSSCLSSISLPSAPSPIRSVCFLSPSRLLIASLSGQLHLLDLCSYRVIISSPSYGGPIYSFALSPDLSTIALACHDGSVRLLDTSSLSYRRSLVVSGAPQILSVQFTSDHSIIAGTSDGTLRFWSDIRAPARVLRVQPDICVWSLLVLPDGVVVSADSSGTVSFWDLQSLTCVQQLQTHSAAVLALALETSSSQPQLFCSGIDSKLTCLQRVADGQWVISSQTRVHSHDVLALAAHPSRPWLASGGIDTQLALITVDSTQPKHLRLSPFVQRDPVQTLPSRDWMLDWHNTTVRVWAPPRLLVQLNVTGSSALVSVALGEADQGAWVAASDLQKMRLYRLRETGASVDVNRVSTKGRLLPASAMCFGKDLLVLAAVEGKLQRVSLPELEVEVEVEGNVGMVNCLRMSRDGKYVASATEDGAVYVYRAHELEQVMRVPVGDAGPVMDLTWSPDNAVLAVLYASGQIASLKLPQCRWQNETRLTGHPIGFHFVDEARLVVFGRSFMQKVTLKDASDAVCQKPKPKRRRVALSAVTAGSAKQTQDDGVCRRYRPLVYAGPFKDGLAVVEMAWLGIMQRFKPVLARPRYGT